MRIKVIFIRLRIVSAFLLLSNLLFAQQKTISGKVIEATTGQPVIGSTIAVKGSKEATQTNSDGTFTLSIPNSAKTLSVSSVGFESQNISINGDIYK